MTFTAPFNGAQNIYMAAAEIGINTGWVQKGTTTCSRWEIRKRLLLSRMPVPARVNDSASR